VVTDVGERRSVRWVRRCARCRTTDRREIWDDAMLAHTEATHEPRHWFRRRMEQWRCPACGNLTYEIEQAKSGE
jgi:hypothetical protein